MSGKVLTIFCSLLVVSVFTFAQSDPAAGILPFSTQAPGIFESVDLATGNINVQIPVRQKTGKIPLSYSLVTNSHAYKFQGPLQGGHLPPPVWRVSGAFSGSQLAGQTGFDVTLGYSLAFVSVTCGTTKYNNVQQLSNFSVADSTGASHPFPGLEQYYEEGPCGGGSPPATYTTEDGSGYTMVVSSYTCGVDTCNLFTIYDKSGYILGPSSLGSSSIVQDPDGASITETGSNPFTITDTLGATALTITDGSIGSPQTYGYIDAANNPQAFQVNYTSYTQQTAFGCTGNSPQDIAPTSIYLPGSITTPTSTIKFTYETTPHDTHMPHYVTGRLASITYPSGGSVSYTYTGGNNGVSCSTQVVPTLTRTVNDGNGHITKWTYVNSDATLGQSPYTTTVTDPANNQTVYTFTGGWSLSLQSEAQYYEGAATGTPLKTVNTYYTFNSPSGCPQCYISQTNVLTYLGSSTSPSEVQTNFDSYGNVTSLSNYGFGATYPPSGSSVSTTTTAFDYPASPGGSYPCGTLNPYIYDRPCSITTTGPSGTVSQTSYTYNSTGHPVTTSTWVSPSSSLTSTATYNTNGTLATATDVNGALYSYVYNGTDGCNSLLATSVEVTGTGLPSGGLTTSTEWDCNGGVSTLTTDANGQPTHTEYELNGVADPFYRPRSSVDALNNTTSFSYSPTTVESAMNFNGTASTTDALTTADSLGRPIYQQQRQGQGPATLTFDTTQTAYGWTITTSTVQGGKLTTQTVPYSGTAAQPAPNGTAATQTQYDALSRPLTVTDGGGGKVSYTYVQNDVLQTVGPPPSGENTKGRQLQYDGLGRLTSVCEITSVSGSGAGNCGQSNPQTGLLTTYTYTYNSPGRLVMTVAQNSQPGAIGGQQSRTYTYDGLIRLISESNPETGTTTYTYDNDATCGTYKGDLVKRVDALGNVTCFKYDALHRQTSVTYPSGPYAATTASKTFVYDTTTFSCTNGANVAGRLAEAFTGPSTAKITDEGFCYSPRGETTDIYESTPHSGGYYQIPMTYWANGLVQTFGPFFGDPQLTYTPDGEGRIGAISDLGFSVPSITYTTPSGQPTGNRPAQIMTSCVGSTCYPITYQYDPNTLRMTGYSAALNGGTVSGALNWNPNGSLQQLAIADPFNSADVQTCTYGADDLSRIASVNCMNGTTNVWAQNFTYDAFGNITKQVPTNGTGISWIPGYNASTNRYTLEGTSYDANGNVTNDTFAGYAWDGEGKILSTAYSNGQTYSFVYDAFGHEVEWLSNGTYELSYITIGNYKLSAMGQSPWYAEYPYPGGSLTSEGAGLTAAQMADWLGTSRAIYTYTGGNWIKSIAHAPFGETYVGNAQNFTGQWSDADTVNTTYYFPERQYRSSQGRWLSPDPAALQAADPSNPQSWNRYAYVLNSPLSLTDPMGLWCVWGDKSHDPDPDIPSSSPDGVNKPDPESGDSVGGGGANQGQCAAQGGYWDPFDIVTGCDDNTGKCTTNDGSTASICGNEICYGLTVVNVTADAPSKFADCLKNNAHWYSAAGVVDLLAGTNFSETVVGNAIGGNDVTGIAFMFVGGSENASESAGAGIAKSVEHGVLPGIGKQLFIGGNSANRFQTLIPRLGRPAQALARAPALTKFLGAASGYFEAKALLDLGLAGALVVNCGFGQI